MSGYVTKEQLDAAADESGFVPFRVQIVNPTKQALDEIGNRSLHQKDVAQTLSLALQWGQRDEVDWKAVADAAVARWSVTGWKRIKSLMRSDKCWDD